VTRENKPSELLKRKTFGIDTKHGSISTGWLNTLLRVLSPKMSGSRSSSPNSISEWSPQEDKKFEQALAYYGEDTPNRWHKVSIAMGGSKSAEEVWYHYLDLVDDVNKIETRQVPYPKYKEQGFWTYSGKSS
jgi:hypothetical protein